MKTHESGSEQSSSLTQKAIANPHFVVVSCILVAILGGLCLVNLPKDLLPAANLPAVQILSFYSGMPVEHVEKNLTARFERYTGQAIGIQKQESKSLLGVSIVKNFFGPSTDLNTAISQTTSLVMSVLRRLPPGTQPPLILPFDPTATVPLGLVAVSGDMKEKELYDTARYDVRNTIQAVTGAMAPTVMGGAERQVVVFLDPHKLQNFNFSGLDVMESLGKLNTFIPSGDVKIQDQDYQIVSNGLVDRIADMNDFPLRSKNGVPIYLKDVGEAQDSHKIQTNIVTVDGRRQVYVPLFRQPGANSIRVVDEVKRAMADLEKKLSGIKLTFVADQSSFIRHAIASITEEALIGGTLAALMVLLFLGNPRATVGIVLSLPLSLLFAFIGLQITGQTINAMTLGGLALSIGVLVDNSIVVLENVSKKIEHGMKASQAALVGTQEVTMPVVAATISTLIVFFPVMFLTGIVKILFSALAVSVIFAMVGSLIASLTVIPLFASRFLRVHMNHRDLPGLLRLTTGLMHGLAKRYERALGFCLQHRGLVLTVVMAVLVAGASLAPRIGTELFPRADAGNFVLELREKTGTRVESTERMAQQIEAKLREWIPPSELKMLIANIGVYYGFPAAFTPNSGPQDFFFNVELTEDRKFTSQHYAQVVRENLRREYPQLDVGVQLGGLLTSALNGGQKTPIDVQVQGPDLEKAHDMARTLSQDIVKLHGAADVCVQQRFDAPQINLDVDRHKAMELGVTTDEVVKNVVSAVSGSASFNPAIWVDPKSGIDYLLGVQFPENAVTNLQELAEIPIRGPSSEKSVPLSRLAKITEIQGPSEVHHVNLKPVIDIFMDAQGVDIGTLSKQVMGVITKFDFPKGYSAQIKGEVSEMQDAVQALGGGFVLAAVLVYLILVIQFRSFALPSIIMATVPMGLVGIIVMLALTHTYFSIQAAIGAIFMIGIAVANGVLLVEFMNHNLGQFATLDEAIIQGAGARLRPILMTSMASMLGLVPMAIGLGHGSEANIPLGRAVIGGQLLSTVLTLFVVPILFRMVSSLMGPHIHSADDSLEARQMA